MSQLKKKFDRIVGAEHCTEDQRQTEGYARDESIYTGTAPSIVVRPASAEEIGRIVKLANREKLPLIPVSSSIHFNGATLPCQGGCIVDLGRMNRIIRVDLRNRQVMIEPGVKWQQLQNHLAAVEMTAMNPLLPHAGQSALSSCLERMPPLIPKFEYAEPLSTVEVVLPAGDLLRTGSAASPGAPFDTVADMVCPYGPGLDFYRLFQGAQGTLGIVTWGNLKIEYLSPLKKTFYLQGDELTRLLAFMQKIQRLMIGNECFLLKRSDWVGILGRGDAGVMASLAEKLARYTVVLRLAGTRRRPQERIAYQEKAFGEICAEYDLTATETIAGFEQQVSVFEERLKGSWPENETYWKQALRGQCHDIPFHTTIDRLPGIVDDIQRILSAQWLGDSEFGLYIQPLEYGRAYFCRYHLYYDPQAEAIKRHLMALDQQVNRQLFLAGTLFNTPNEPQSALTFSHSDLITDTLKKVKRIFDPNGIMNPGKLCF